MGFNDFDDMDDIAEGLESDYADISSFGNLDIEEPDDYGNVGEFTENMDSLNFFKDSQTDNNKEVEETTVTQDINPETEEMLKNIASSNYSSVSQEPEPKKVNIVFPEGYVPKSETVNTNTAPTGGTIFNEEIKEEPEEASGFNFTAFNTSASSSPNSSSNPKTFVNYSSPQEENKEVEEDFGVNEETSPLTEDMKAEQFSESKSVDDVEVEFMDNDDFNDIPFVKAKKTKEKVQIVNPSLEPVMRFLKKYVASFLVIVISVGLIIGLPILLSKDGNKDNTKEPTKVTISTEEDTVSEVDTTEITTETIEENVFLPTNQSTATRKNIFEEAKAEANSYIAGGTGSSRFNSLDDITFYVEGATMSALSAEKQAVTSYSSGLITYEEFIAIIDENTKTADSINHLLIANEKSYIDEGKEEKYKELMENNNILILYGDTVRYKASQGK